MSYKDMFRKEQRFSFRKFSFGLASAVIANVILGGAIANSPVVHANTVTEAETAVAPANQDLGNETKTEEEPKEPIEAVRTDMENRAAEILPEALNASVTNQAPVIPTIGRNAGLSAKNNDARQYEVLHVFGNVSGTTEAESTTGSATAPDFVPENANKAFLATDPEGEDVTIIYGVPGNITAYEAGNPGSLTTNGGDRLSAETKSLGNESNTELVLDDQGRLTGKFPYAPGGLYSRIIKMTDTAGNVSYSNPFYVVAYTDKRADNADLIVGQESDLTATNIFSKLKIDTTSGYSTTNQSLTVPETEYTRTIVGYRLTGTNDVQNLSADTLNTLPAGGNYEIKVKTTNQYGQTIYNWVPVNDTRTKEVSKEDLFVFNNSPIQTVDGTNKVKVVTVEDKDGVQAIDYYQTPNNQRSDLKGATITPEAVTSTNKVEGYVTGTPAVDAIGYYTRSFGVTDAKGNLVITYPNVSGGEDKRQVIHVMDTNVTGPVTKQAGEIPTKNEILAKVTVNYGTPHKKITNPTSMYSMDLAPDQKVPTEPGEYDVKVRVVTASNVYKDVTVKVIIPKYSDVLTAKAEENTSLVPGSGVAATQPITLTKEEVVDGQKTNVATTAPAGTAYAVEQKFLSEKQALGYEISVSETGEVSVKAPAGQEVDITVPVTVAYPDNSTDTVNVLFKVNQKDLAQIEAKKAIDDKLAEVIKELEAKRDATIAEIDDNIELTDVQKEAAKNAITAVADNALKDLDTKAAEAKEKIEKATTVLEINTAKTDGEIALDSAKEAGKKAIDKAKDKAEAKAEVENEAFEALEKVNNNPNLLEEEKKAYFDDIKESKEVAVEKINNAGNTDEITAAIDEAEIAYNEDVINAAQLDALNKLEKDSEETKAAIDANPNLTPEEKAKAIAKVEELVNNAESDILSKPTPETVQAVEDKADKDLAKVALQAAADDAKKGIEANPNLTPEEKESAKNAVEDAVKVATAAIDKASTPAEVDTATSDGVKAIDAEEFKATQKDAKNKIAKEAESAKKAIDDNPNLTPDEKESAKNAVEEAAKVATDAIDKASTPIAVQVEEHKGVAAINLITAKADAKGAVAAKLADEIKKLKDKQAEAEKAIDASTMTNEEKAIAKKALQDVVDKGKADLEDAAWVATNEIHEATTTEKAKAAELAGEKSLTDTGKEARDAVELAKDKELAKEAIRTEEEEATKIVEKLAEDTRKAIEDNPNLSDEDKQAEIKKLTDAVAKTLETIRDNATTAMQEAEKAQALADLEKAKETQKIADKAAIDRLTILVKDGELEATKQDAKNKIAKDAAAAKEAIASNPNLTDAEKKTFTDAVDAEVAKANDAISAATSPADVQKEEDAGVAAIAEDVLDAAKQDAKNKIAKDAAAAKEAIASNPNLSDEAKEAAKKAVDTDAQAATDAIDKALKPDAVQAEEDKGVAAITKDVLDAAKQDAKNKIAKEAAAAKEAIASNPNLTDAEKKTFTDAVDAEVAKANDAISAATSPADVQKEEDAGVAAIAEDVLDAAKQDAKNKIAKESAAAKSAIDANPNLTPEEKESAKKAIDTDAQAATAAIDKASTPDAVQVEEDKGVAAINLITAKADAKGVIAAKLADEIKKLEDKQAEAEKAIDASTMTNEEKAIAKKALQDVVDKGKAELEDAARVATNEIHKATTAEDAKAATLAGEKSLTDTGKEARDAVEWAKDKELAKEAIRTEEEEATRIVEKLAENALKAINSDPNLSDEDKQAEIKKLTDVVTKTLETIHDNATKATQEAEKTQALADLEKVKETQKIADKAAIDGLTSLVKDGELEAMKQDAKNKIAKDAAAAKEAIGSNPNLTDAEKKTFTDVVDAEVAKANDAISAATSPADVQKEEDAGVAAIAEDVLDAAKQDAKNKIAKEVDAAKEAIDANPNLSDAEKEASKKAVDADAKAATDAIDASTSPVEAQSAEDKGVGSIAQDVLDAAKQDAKNKIAKESDAAKSAIDANQNLTDAEKESAKKAVDADAKVATDAIAKASTPDAVQAEEDKGVGAIAKDVLDAAKQDAKNKIAKEAESAKSVIDSNPNLTDAEKEASKKAVDADAQAATDAIDASTSPVEAQSAEDKGVGSIAQDVLDAAKQDAKNKIAKESDAAKSAIDANPNLTDAEKESAKKAVDADAQAATDAIDASTSPVEAQSAEDKGVGSIAQDVLDAAKQDAKNKIAKESDAAKSVIDSNPNLTDAEKDAAKKAVDADAKAATDAIDASTSPVEAQSAEDKGVGSIAQDVLDAAKQDAKNKIAKEAESAKSAIDAKPNLTDAEKDAAKKAVDADAKAATDAIDASTSPVEAQSAEDKGVGAIAKDVLDAAKQDAKNKIAKEAESAKSAIDSNPNLTDAAKEAAKSEIDKAVDEAIVLINGVRTHQELEKIKLPMAALIKPAAKVTPVVDPNNLTEKEIARIKAFLKENNNLPEGTEINVSKDASVTIKYPDGTIDLLSPVEVVKQADKTAPTVANDGKGNIVIVPSEKAVEIVVSYVDNNGKSQTVVVTKGTDGLWTASNTVVIVDPVTGQVIVPGSVIKPGTVVTAYSKDEVGNSSDSAEAEVVAVDENNSAAGVKVKSVTTNANNVEKKAKQLPNTGEEANSATSLGLVALGLGLALLAAKRRRDEEA
ncbi:YSIRK signal domain/LPXTG anchor domain surface protein [Streptococcus suis]|uniref:YSIRK signal domain/LPXTG anchor domain surface protein n=1 Tax=Streptococcus suis TaxID=1307 RepID=UPI0005CE76A8|nr:YSIRK signal domain/LPXTG anchor domain surface protein [Streptococcus suis]